MPPIHAPRHSFASERWPRLRRISKYQYKDFFKEQHKDKLKDIFSKGNDHFINQLIFIDYPMPTTQWEWKRSNRPTPNSNTAAPQARFQ